MRLAGIPKTEFCLVDVCVSLGLSQTNYDAHILESVSPLRFIFLRELLTVEKAVIGRSLLSVAR